MKKAKGVQDNEDECCPGKREGCAYTKNVLNKIAIANVPIGDASPDLQSMNEGVYSSVVQRQLVSSRYSNPNTLG